MEGLVTDLVNPETQDPKPSECLAIGVWSEPQGPDTKVQNVLKLRNGV